MYQQVLDFWFKEIEPKQWWVKDEKFDQAILTRFADIHQQANAGELYHWRETPQGRLAEIIVLDQFSRNMFRDSPKAFASDPLALVLSQVALKANAHEQLAANECSFLFMPYMHSESLKVHNVALDIFKEHCSHDNYEFEIKHRNIIKQFGRYPHRNTIMGRASNPEEVAFLKQPGSSF